MKIHIFLLLAILVSLASCESNTQKTSNTDAKKENLNPEKTTNPEGLALMQQKCFICHFKTPDPARKDQMIAPPMMRVQEHYLPNYPKKEDFVNAIISWTNNPTEEHTLMPGTVRKFKLMPKLGYDEADVRIIAEYLFEMDFESNSKMANNNASLELNDGKKWKLNTETLTTIKNISKKLNSFESNDINDYHQLGRDVFDSAKTILIEGHYDGSIYSQLQNFFHKVEENMHKLIATESIDDAQKEVNILKKKFKSFGKYFE